MAYCMLGIFDINMPTLYGEGGKAFLRLQEEILRTSDDHSLFAWIDKSAADTATSGLLALSPKMFAYSSNVVSFRDWTEATYPFSLSNSGLSITLPMDHSSTIHVEARSAGRAVFRPVQRQKSSSSYRGFLNCAWSNDRRGRVYVELLLIGEIAQQFCRTNLALPLHAESPPKTVRQIYVRQFPTLPLPQDIIHPQPFIVELRHEGLASDYALRAYLHDESAIYQKNWFATLMRQKAFEANGGDSVFLFPGQPRQLVLVLLMEYLPTFSKFFLMLGSGHKSHLPMMDYRVIRPSEHILYNDLQHFLQASRVVPAMDTYVARLDKSFVTKRMTKVKEWLDQFRFVYDPLNRNSLAPTHEDALTGGGTRTCTQFSMSGVDHHVQIERLDDEVVQSRGRISVKLRIGGHNYSDIGIADHGRDGCSQVVPKLGEKMKSRTA